MATQPLTATFSVQVRDALSSVASEDEISVLEAVMDCLSRGRGKLWMLEYIIAILERLIPNDPQGRQ